MSEGAEIRDSGLQVVKTRGPYRDYSLDIKAQAIALLKANDGNVGRTARELNIPDDTVRYWLNNPSLAEIHTQKRLELSDLAESNAYKLGLSINSLDLSDVSLSQQATAFGIMVDKMQLLRGQPTSISENIERKELTVVLEDALNDVIDVK